MTGEPSTIGGHFLDADARNVVFIAPNDEPFDTERLMAASWQTAHPSTIVGAAPASTLHRADGEMLFRTQTVLLAEGGARTGRAVEYNRHSTPIIDIPACGRLFERLLNRPLDSTQFDVSAVVAAEMLLAQGFGATVRPVSVIGSGTFIVGTTPFGELPYTEIDQLEVTIVLPGSDVRLGDSALASHSSRGYPDTAIFCAMTGSGSVDAWSRHPHRSASLLAETIERLEQRAARHSAYVLGVATRPSEVRSNSLRPRSHPPHPVVTIAEGAATTVELLGRSAAFLTASDGEAGATRALLATIRPNTEHRVLSLGSRLSSCMLEPASIAERLEQLCHEALADGSFDAVVLASPGLYPLVQPLRNSLGVTVIDGVAAGIALAESILTLNRLTDDG
ncbi:aspartate/glutamate racemase family protein [Subtercola endophyticus]|uniref:aspartate/glutamate racemase family protein n=1 Tax=Subtercola endophyticus TaxID=2895559 RepID=UPI001E5C7D3D|nr:aspartate/glutamate racemase family protein [Subtercola endophyticus]UFS58220.1 aspartate/glutamate racemase family protein [Subtercola endophyticus]